MASDKRRVALPAAVCVLLLGLAGWRFSSCAEPNLSQPELANAIFNGVNYAALGLIGLGCLFWPGSSGGQDQRAVPVAAPQTSHVGGGGIAYLANLKTFLTVVVVAHHASNQFGGPPIAMPIGTYAYDPRSPIGAAAGTDSFGVFSSALQAVDQMYFMSLFFLVSGIFCPASLDNKGFRAFVLGKILRLGGPLAIFSIILGPATIAWTAHYGGVPVQWVYFAGPCWFILWLLNFSVAYAALATVVPKVVAPKPNPPMLLLLPPSLASLGLIAYCFGCRHGVDADHIAAIDGVTRKLVAAGQRPLLVGLFFSLGHCAVVFVICGSVVASSSVNGAQMEAWEGAGAAIGPWVAAAVLLCLGVLNVFVARDLLSQWRLRQA